MVVNFVSHPHILIRKREVVQRVKQTERLEVMKMSEMENWNDFTTTVVDYCKTGSIDEVDASYVKRMIEKGTGSPTRQSRISSAIRETLRDYEDNPFVSRGFQLPTDAQTVLDAALEAMSGLAEAFYSNPAVAALLLPHGKANYSHFTDGAHWASTITDKMTVNAVALFKSGDWNGSVKSLTSTIGGQS